ncbi:MAG: 2-oxoacid:acceptor oxidoreductase subunit alpha [Kiritimatiellae bacterium]|nr:2-oxoacid:acceptor oxidoreductase subunit alpha [Kiritimatiellia bacterium]
MTNANEQPNALQVVIGGEAGQGLVTISELLCRSLVRAGYHIVATQSYMSRIRGGHNTFAIRVASAPIAAPQEPIDLLVALNADTFQRHRPELAPGALVIADEKEDIRDVPVLNVPFERLASKTAENMAACGIVGAILGLERATLEHALESFFDGKHPEGAEDNRKAISSAYDWIGAQKVAFRNLPAPPRSAAPIMLNGNEALALGALNAGVKFCAFYPMTPATTVPLTLIKHAGKMGTVVEQAEDEIAAINMAIGASFAGAPAMVATSGGGFALMVESVSLAGMTETPVVIVVAQRPAPATGLPTRTEQADLEFVLHAGHGEFPRAILTPGSVEECFELAQKAFLLADRYQGPVFLLTDQFLADTYRDIVPFTLDTPPHWPAPPEPDNPPYKRYALTETGISPRLIPGLSRHRVVADSDEHTEDGHITEDLDVRRAMVEKRLHKMLGLEAEVSPPVFQGDAHPDLLLVSWGSSRGAVEEAAAIVRAGGTRAGTLHFPQVWPLVPKHFLDTLTSAPTVVAIEGNATGQFARLIRAETGFHIPHHVLRYDGLPFTPEYILRRLPHGTTA